MKDYENEVFTLTLISYSCSFLCGFFTSQLKDQLSSHPNLARYNFSGAFKVLVPNSRKNSKVI